MIAWAVVRLSIMLAVGIPQSTLKEVEDRIQRGIDTVFVLHFWATWCKTCDEDLPTLQQVQKTTFSRPVRVILISLDQPANHQTLVEPWLRRKGIRLPCVLLDTYADDSWTARVDSSWTGSIPATLITDAGATRRFFFDRPCSYAVLRSSISSFHTQR
ncbi:MAG: TlpA disulfide reductase family protein [Candidatus Kapaibacteriota bacterium]